MNNGSTINAEPSSTQLNHHDGVYLPKWSHNEDLGAFSRKGHLTFSSSSNGTSAELEETEKKRSHRSHKRHEKLHRHKQQHVTELESSKISYLQEQQTYLLRKLHKEIENLRIENQDLQYKLATKRDHHNYDDEKRDLTRIASGLKKKVKYLKNDLNTQQETINNLEEQLKNLKSTDIHHLDHSTQTNQLDDADMKNEENLTLGQIQSIDPLLIRVSDGSVRTPTDSEMKRLIVLFFCKQEMITNTISSSNPSNNLQHLRSRENFALPPPEELILQPQHENFTSGHHVKGGNPISYRAISSTNFVEIDRKVPISDRRGSKSKTGQAIYLPPLPNSFNKNSVTERTKRMKQIHRDRLARINPTYPSHHSENPSYRRSNDDKDRLNNSQ